MSNTHQQINGLSKSKSICIMLIVIGCFVVLWPRIFYPMLLVGMNWRKDSPSSFGRSVNDQTLPPKVMQAIQSNPIRDSAKIQRLPGRPQFYAGARDSGRSRLTSPPTQGSMMNLMVPLYTIIVAVVFIYIMLKMSFNNDSNQPQNNETNRREQAAFVQTSQSTNIRDPLIQSMPSYKAFNKNGNANESISTLIKDIETFRNYLEVAEVCRCKLKKYEMARKEAENCLKENEQTSNNDSSPIDVLERCFDQEENINDDNQDLINESSNEANISLEKENEIDTKIETDQLLEKDANQEENKENQSEIKAEQKEEKKTRNNKMKRRKRKVKQTRIEDENIQSEMAKTKIFNQFHAKKCDESVLKKWNQEFNRLTPRLKDD
ncbi:hypothetical protein RDWZM_000085 [Blomia tropicalis]|uniref:Resistance to inhibitors of cholinesterase protein 3 N-terminal domain-containing protein n=1 Tax=Blomia tropicalis TaxID=40697 RepID=A0A9Q0MD04_BLOTA|nr:hypothetical protein BLOT_015746 [Blomia tropicalis]KAJ6221540.1 hypothetical protein RDWZM_000085 [Blomia tropicalis]